jgi:poly(beta-D-mannuronate) lyase
VLRGEKSTFADHVTIRGSRLPTSAGRCWTSGEAGGSGLYGAETGRHHRQPVHAPGRARARHPAGRDRREHLRPAVRISGSAFRDVASGQPSMKLDGVQVVKLDANLFERAAPARVTIHVGKPDLSEAGNTGAALEIVDQRK